MGVGVLVVIELIAVVPTPTAGVLTDAHCSRLVWGLISVSL